MDNLNIYKEVFIKDLEEIIFPSLDFMKLSTDHSAYITQGGKKISVPNYVGEVKIFNGTPGPQDEASTYGERKDAFIEYNIEGIFTEPTAITVTQELFSDPNLRDSSIRAHAGTLTTYAKNSVLNSWASIMGASSSNMIKTTGASSTNGNLPSATGNRKKLVLADIKDLARMFDRDRMPKEGRTAYIPSDMYYQLLEDDNVLSIDFMNNKAQIDGIVNKLYGVDIITDPEVIAFQGTTLLGVSDFVGASGSYGTLNNGVLAWSKSAVASCLHRTDIFLDVDDPKNYGNSFLSAGLFIGASPLRGLIDNAGVYSIVQDSI